MDIVYEIVKAAEDRFGIYFLKPFQILVMHRIIAQDEESEVRNQVVILPTGTGKSLCFQIPSLFVKGLTIVVYPLLALMNDQKKTLEKAKIPYANFRGGQTKEQRRAEVEKLERGAKIVITNPETLCQKQILAVLGNYRISMLVCDEAHVIHYWQSFRPKYLKISDCIKALNPHQILAFTATADEDAMATIRHVLFKNRPLVVRGNIDRPNVYYKAVPCLDKLYGLRSVLDSCEKPAIVFCKSRKMTYGLCIRSLRVNPGIKARYYHAGLSRRERESIEEWFMKSTDGVLFATCAYGMGVSKNNVRSVIHYDLPSNVLEYLQESGRAGRDGFDSTAYVLVDFKPKNLIEEIFTQNSCRREALLRAMGQEETECSGCDICCGEQPEVFGRNEIVKAVSKRPLMFTKDSLSLVLNGFEDSRLIQDGCELDPFYALLSSMNCDEIERSIEKLISEEVLIETFFAGKTDVLCPADKKWYKILKKTAEAFHKYGGQHIGSDIHDL